MAHYYPPRAFHFKIGVLAWACFNCLTPGTALQHRPRGPMMHPSSESKRAHAIPDFAAAAKFAASLVAEAIQYRRLDRTTN